MLISLRGCASWSVPLLLVNRKDRFSHVVAHIILLENKATSPAKMPSFSVCLKGDFLTLQMMVEKRCMLTGISWAIKMSTDNTSFQDKGNEPAHEILTLI